MASSGASVLIPAGRRVIVTGALGGIGQATVELLESLGCAVAGCDVDDFDVRNREAVDAGVAALVERLDGCDAVIRVDGGYGLNTASLAGS
jgi:NADP-dependent 3-hydroxy acid dehydrogenase YdfG